LYSLSGDVFSLTQTLPGTGGYSVDLKRRTLVVGRPEDDNNYGSVTVYFSSGGLFAPAFGPTNVSRAAPGMACGFSVAIDQPAGSVNPHAVFVGCPTTDGTSVASNFFYLRDLNGSTFAFESLARPTSFAARDPFFVGWDIAIYDGVVVVGTTTLDCNDDPTDRSGAALLLLRDDDVAAGYAFEYTDFGTGGVQPTVFGDLELSARPGCTYCLRDTFYNNTFPRAMGTGVAVSSCHQIIVTDPGRTPRFGVGGVAFQDSDVDCTSDVEVTGNSYTPPLTESSAAVLQHLF